MKDYYENMTREELIKELCRRNEMIKLLKSRMKSKNKIVREKNNISLKKIFYTTLFKFMKIENQKIHI